MSGNWRDYADLLASPQRRRYFEIAKERPDAFRNLHADGIRIILDPAQLQQAERVIADRLQAQGLDPAWSEAGVYYEDAWIWVVRDVTQFPDGGFHAYHRIILKGGEGGVITIPFLDEELVLIRHYRNGIRDWSLEFPRGGPEKDKSAAALAEAELEEEIGAGTVRLDYVGEFASNGGMLTAMMNVYVAHLGKVGAPNRAEGIDSIETMSRERFEDLIRTGRVKDGYTIAAYQLAKLKGYC